MWSQLNKYITKPNIEKMIIEVLNQALDKSWYITTVLSNKTHKSINKF